MGGREDLEVPQRGLSPVSGAAGVGGGRKDSDGQVAPQSPPRPGRNGKHLAVKGTWPPVSCSVNSSLFCFVYRVQSGPPPECCPMAIAALALLIHE